MYAIKQEYVSFTHPERSITRILRKRYKTYRGAEKAARQYRWDCPRSDVPGPLYARPLAETSNAKVIEIEEQ